MKKIKNRKQLQDAKQDILQRQLNLEQTIQRNWAELKDSLHPKHLIKEHINEAVINKTEETLTGESVLKNTLMYGLTLLAKKATDLAEGKIIQMMKKEDKEE